MVGFDAEIMGHHHQFRRYPWIRGGRCDSKAQRGLAPQIRRTRHLELPREPGINSRVRVGFPVRRQKNALASDGTPP
jgi:hypothetical protein